MNLQTNSQPTLPLVEFICLMALMTSFVALSTDSMLPALDIIGAALNAESHQQTHLIVSLFFLGLAAGQLFFGPFSDHFGRKTTILIGMTIFIIGTVICMSADNMETMLMGRLIQAFGAAGPRTAYTAIIRDLYIGDEMAKIMSFIMVLFILIPMLAPIIGQAVLLMFSWQHIFTMFLLIALITLFWYLLRQPETLPLDKRRKINIANLSEAFKFILGHRAVIGVIIGIGFNFGAFLTYLSASQTIFVKFYDVGDAFPYIFAVLALAVGTASFINGKVVVKHGAKGVVRIAMRGTISFGVAFCLLNLAYDGLPPLHFLIPLLFGNFMCIGLLFGNLNSMAMQPLGKMAGVGAAMVGSISSLISVVVSVVIDSFIVDNLYPLSIGFVVCFVATLLCVKFAQQGSVQER